MNLLEANAKRIDTLLLAKYQSYFRKIENGFLKNNLDKTVIVNRSALIRRMIQKTPLDSFKKKNVYVNSFLEEKNEMKNTRYCQENICFQLENLKKIHLEPLLKEKNIKKMEHFPIKKKFNQPYPYNLPTLSNNKIKEIKLQKN